MENQQIALAENYIRHTGTSVFLTGKAGTGKTTFLRHIVDTCSKRFVVVAPTGVAAINAGGVTIHSFFQLPPSAYLPTVKGFYSEYSLPENKHNLRKNKIKILQSLDLLIIDEASMVRADLLDAIDDRLRTYRHNDKPFGGVQLLMVGDLYQLPPVVKDDEWQYMQQVYSSPFFFESKAFKRLNYISIELTHVYRQSETEFVEILNSIRQSRPTAEILNRLNSRYIPNFDPDDSQKYIRLTTHNAQANDINQQKLDRLPGKKHTFEAEITGTFPEYMYPTDPNLALKKGAQVMFVRNDPSPDKRYYNGKIVVISDIGDDHLQVSEPDGTTFDVEPITWENTKYELNEESKEIEAIVDGTFKQLPLRLAWAITIHKSQGLTFDHAIIDAGRAFAFGQTYVALSRCRTLEGLVLKTPVTENNLFSDNCVKTFTNNIPSSEAAEKQYHTDLSQYYFGKLYELFDFGELQKLFSQMHRLLSVELAASHPQKAPSFDNHIEQPFFNNIVSVSEKFHRQLAQLQAQCGGNTGDAFLQERVNKASDYFLKQMTELSTSYANYLNLSIKNKETKKRYVEISENTRKAIELKKTLLKNALQGFSVESYNRTTSNFVLAESDTPQKAPVPTAKLNQHSAEFLDILRDWRSEQSYAHPNRPPYSILTESQMVEIAQDLPVTKTQLMAISGFGKEKFDEFGTELLNLTQIFCEAHDIKKKKPKGQSLLYTLELINQGLSPEQTAKERGLALSTIQGHIEKLIKEGRLSPDSYISTADYHAIAQQIAKTPEATLIELSKLFDGKYDYFTLRVAMAKKELSD